MIWATVSSQFCFADSIEIFHLRLQRIYLMWFWFLLPFVAQLVKNLLAMWETWVWLLSWEDLLEKGKAPVFWPGEFHGLYSPWVFPSSSDSKASTCNAGDLGSIPGWGRSPGEGNGNPLQYSCLENPTDRGAWQVTVNGVAKSRTWLSSKTQK